MTLVRVRLAVSAIVLAGCSTMPFAEPGFEVAVENHARQPVWLEIVPGEMGAPEGPPISEPILVPQQPGARVRFPVPEPANWHLRVRGHDGFFDGREFYDLSRRVAAGECDTFMLSFAHDGSASFSTDCEM